MVSGNGSPSHSQPVKLPRGVYWGRFSARVALLLMGLFILIWWPVDEFTPEGFDAWSIRMGALPDEIWVIIGITLGGWSAVETVAARHKPSLPPPPPPPEEKDPMMLDEMGMDGPPMDGEFANAHHDDPLLDQPMQPNPVIDEWRANAPEQP